MTRGARSRTRTRLLVTASLCAALPAAGVPGREAAAHGPQAGPVGSTPHPCVTYAPPRLSAGRLARLRRSGQQVSVRTHRFRSKPPLIELRTLLYAPEPAWLAWTVMRDYEAWSKFVPRLERSVVRRDDGRTAEIFTLTDVPWPLPDLEVLTRAVHDRCGNDHWLVRWRRLSGSVHENRGFTLVWPATGGGTLVQQRFLLGADLPISAELAARGVRHYFQYVVRSFREQMGRAHKGVWYGTTPPPPLTATARPSAGTGPLPDVRGGPGLQLEGPVREVQHADDVVEGLPR